jgi:hypothetical protein
MWEGGLIEMEISVVLTSAAVAAVVSGLFTFVSQWLERRARRKELLLKTSTDWAVKHLEQALQLGKDRGGRVGVPALGWLAQDYYHQLTTLLKRGTLPPETQQEYDTWLQRSGQAGGVGAHRHASAEANSSSGESTP